jgi:curli biogenesis system outer membrane secretion channel CsgG
MRLTPAQSVLLAALLMIGCASARVTEQNPPVALDAAVNTLPLPPYSGSKARVVVAAFDVKAPKATGDIGVGLREMFIAALTRSNRFTVADRSDPTQALSKEQNSDGVVDEQDQKPSSMSKARQADLLIAAAVSEFEPQSSGGRAGIGGGGGVGSGVLGALLGTSLNRAHLAVEIKIIDPLTSEVIAQTVVQGQASDTTGGVLQGVFGGWSLGAGLSAYANTPMEKAVRMCIIDAVRYVSDTVPSGFYRE